MDDMTRRTWLTGMVTSVIGAQLVIAAKGPVDGIIVPDREVKIFKPEDVPASGGASLMGDVYVKNADGQFMPIGFIRSMNISIDAPISAEFEGQIYGVRRTYSSRSPNSARIEGDIYLFGGERMPTRLDLPTGGRFRV